VGKPESAFMTGVYKYLPPLSELHREKMANPYRGGTADWWYRGRVTDLWIEAKYITIPARLSTLIAIPPPGRLLSPLQADWLASRHAEGRNVWVLVGSRSGGVIFQGVSWEKPITAGDFTARLMTRQQLAERISAFVQGP